jgi:type 1 glutamine amidotransferase
MAGTAYSLSRCLRAILVLGVVVSSGGTLFGRASSFAQDTLPFFGAGKVRVLIFSGRNNHDWRTSTPFLCKLLVDSGRFDVRVEEEPARVTAATLAAYDVVVLDYEGPRWGEVREKAVEDFVKQGKGLVAVHAANYSFTGLEVLADGDRISDLKQPPWTEYSQMIGGWWTLGAPKSSVAPRHCFTAKIVDREHPVARGLVESFRTCDEIYENAQMLPAAHILATAFDDPADGGTGKEEPIIWTVNCGKGRVLYEGLGHDAAAQRGSAFVSTFVRGVEWAATRAVTVSAAGTLPSAAHRPSVCWWSPAVTSIPPPSTRSLKGRTTSTGIMPSRTTRLSMLTSAKITMCWCSTTCRWRSATQRKPTSATLWKRAKASWCYITPSRIIRIGNGGIRTWWAANTS